ncbi:ABC transporter substrate-binding protein [Xylophilus sp. GW821-FHT01B05]
MKQRLWAVALALFTAVPALAAGLPQVIRLAAPEQGSSGHSFAGAQPLSLVYARKALEEEFAKDGVKIEWKFFKGAGPAINEGLTTKQLDIVYLGDLAGVIGRANGLKTRLVAGAARGTNSYLATTQGSGIQSFKDLKGKRVAVLRGTAYQLPFNRLLEEAGLGEKDVRFVNLDWPTSKAALVSKDIDATFGGTDLNLLKENGTALIPVSTRGKPARFSIQSGLIATQDFIDQYPDALVRVLKVVVQQARTASDDSQRAALYDDFVRASGLPLAIFRSEFEGTSIKARYSPLIDDGLVARYKEVVAGAKQIGIIRQSFDVDAWVDRRFIDRALRETGAEGFWEPTDAAGVALKP